MPLFPRADRLVTRWVAAAIGLLSCLLAGAACCNGATVVLTPSQDATLIQWSADVPGNNPLLANGQGDIFVGRTNQDGQEEATISIRRGLVQFDLTNAIPSGMRVVDATLEMRDVRGRNGDPTLTLHRVLSSWGEGASYFDGGQGIAAQEGDATWLYTQLHVPAPSTSPAWNKPGGDFVELASAAAVVSDDLGEGQLIVWTGPGLLDDVQAWLTNPAANFGWLLRGDESRGQSAKRFNSGESTTPPNLPPRLVLEYAPLLAGDYNDDGRVDAADYTVWRDRLGSNAPLANETATPGAITSEDYVIWKSQFGAPPTGAAGAVALPEPAAASLAATLLATTALASGRCARRGARQNARFSTGNSPFSMFHRESGS